MGNKDCTTHHICDCKAATLDEAVRTIIEMQNTLKRWMNPNNFIGEDLTEAYNKGALFLSKHPDLFNEYLKNSQFSEVKTAKELK